VVEYKSNFLTHERLNSIFQEKRDWQLNFRHLKVTPNGGIGRGSYFE